MSAADYEVVSVGVLDILLGARDVPDITHKAYADLVLLCLRTHAWCVREELESNLLLAITQGGGPLSKEIVDGLIEVAQAERLDHVTRLSAYATSLLSNLTKH